MKKIWWDGDLCIPLPHNSESGQIWLLATTSKKNAKTAQTPSSRGLTLHPALAFMVKAAIFLPRSDSELD